MLVIALVLAALGLGLISLGLLFMPIIVAVGVFLAPLIFLIFMLVTRKIHNDHSAKSAKTEAAEQAASQCTDWREQPSVYFDTATKTSQRRRIQTSESLIADEIHPSQAAAFNHHISEATGIAVYGCGILAAAHVGGLRSLEKHGLDYSQLQNLAGVSAGSVVVAMMAIGYRADELFDLVQSLPFPQMAMPELAPLLRAGGHLVSLVCKQSVVYSFYMNHVVSEL